VIAVAPGDLVAVFQPDNNRVVINFKASQFGIGIFPGGRIIVDFQIYAILAEAVVDVQLALFMVAAEHSRRSQPNLDCKFLRIQFIIKIQVIYLPDWQDVIL